MKSFTFHVVSVPYTQTNQAHSACVFTMKVMHFVQMMMSLGHTVYHYGVEGSDVECTERVTLLTKREQIAFFGPPKTDVLYNVDWSGEAPYWQVFNTRAGEEIKKRGNKGDFVCLISGTLNKPIANAVGPDLLSVEFGIGYNGTFAKYRVFESYAQMHKIWTAEGGKDPNGKFYDCVIPNYFDPAEYPPAKKEDFFLYMGRLIQRKGVGIAVEATRAIGAKLILAGHAPNSGPIKVSKGRIECPDGMVYQGNHLEFVGFATGKKRTNLLARAKAIFVPSLYVEPFGAVAVEAQMAGTPAITTDWGAFPETVENGVTGFRCRTLQDFVDAARKAGSLDPKIVRETAIERYSMDNVRWQYERYFNQLADLWDRGWATVR